MPPMHPSESSIEPMASSTAPSACSARSMTSAAWPSFKSPSIGSATPSPPGKEGGYLVHRGGGLSRLPGRRLSFLSLFEPRQADGHAMLAERSIGPHGAGAREFDVPLLDPQLHAVLPRTQTPGRENPCVARESADLPFGEVVLAALERPRSRHPAQGAPVQRLLHRASPASGHGDPPHHDADVPPGADPVGPCLPATKEESGRIT